MAKNVTMRIMRVGKWDDNSGRHHDFTKETLKTIADGFNFTGEEDAIPDIISHDDKSPRVGFVKKLFVGDDGNSLFAQSQMHDDFAQAIDEGFYPSVSVRLSADNTRLQHIAHLGRQKPAIKGLGLPIVEFGEKDGEFIDFAEMTLDLYEQVSSLVLQGITNALYDVKQQQREILDAVRNANGEPNGDNFSESEIKALKEENAKLAAAIKTAQETKASDFAEKLIADGKILPRSKNLVVKEYLAASKNEADFAEFSAEYEKLPAINLKAPVLPENPQDGKNFSSEELVKLAHDFQAQEKKDGKTITFIDALDSVTNGIIPKGVKI